MELLQTTLCYLEKDGACLMLHRVKKKTTSTTTKWVGVGGKFEPGEDAPACALREVRGDRPDDTRRFTAASWIFSVTHGPPSGCTCTPARIFFRRDDRLRRGVLRVGGQGRRAGSSDLAGGTRYFQAAGGGCTVFHLELTYDGDVLVKAVLDGVSLAL